MLVAEDSAAHSDKNTFIR